MIKRGNGSKNIIALHDFIEEKAFGVSFHLTRQMGETAVGDLASNPHRHPFYEIVYVESGDGAHIIDCDTYKNMRDIVFFLTPMQMHHWKDVTDIRGWLIYFSENYLFETMTADQTLWEIDMIGKLSMSGGTQIGEMEIPGIKLLLKMMQDEYDEKGENYTTVLRSYLNAFLFKVYRIRERGRRHEIPDHKAYVNRSVICTAFRRMLNEHLSERLPIQYFADALGVCVGYLEKQVKAHTGLTPGALQRRMRVTEAKRLLANTDMNVSEISERLGFNDAAYFSRFFRKSCGIQPREFKRRMLEKQNL